jgi:hypothetical protein
MSFKKKVRGSWLALSVLFASCSGGSGDQQFSLSVDNAYCPSGISSLESPPDVLRVDSYRVLISGDGLEPIELFLPGNFAAGNIDKIPKGDNRTLLVEALNASGQVICRRQMTGISIEGGKSTPIIVTLLSVPFVTNLSNGNIVTQTRLVFKGYGEPAGAIEILDLFNGSETVLTDLETSSDLISPSTSDAGFVFKPAILPLGIHLFTVRDAGTGESSQVSVTLVTAGREPGRGIVAAGFRNSSQHHASGRSDLFSEVLEELTK